jgi:hypothetical protein
MQPIPSVLFLLAVLAYVGIRLLRRLESARSEPLKWWEKAAGILAFIAVVMIAINPEFFALGLLGDTGFFDLLVLLISLQLQIAVGWAWGWGGAMVSKLIRWAMAPSPHMSYLLVAWALGATWGVLSAIHRVITRSLVLVLLLIVAVMGAPNCTIQCL